jgi:DNA invertase Pin-like site-specific DNA recombinase
MKRIINDHSNFQSKKQKNTSELVSKKRTKQIDFNLNFNSKKQKLNNNVIIYCRISTKNQSLEAQEFTCKEYCKNNNYNIINIIHEVGSAYKNVKLSKLENIIKNNFNITLLIYSIDRFSRNVTKCNELLTLIENNNITLKSVKEDINLLTPIGRHNFRNHVSQAQFESEMISERIKNTLNYKKLNTPAYGYLIENNTKIIDKKEDNIYKFLIINYQQHISSKVFTERLFKLLNILEKPNESYIKVDFYNNDEIIDSNKSIKITAEMLSDIFNEYDINNRNKLWSIYKIKKLYNNCNNLTLLSL